MMYRFLLLIIILALPTAGCMVPSGRGGGGGGGGGDDDSASGDDDDTTTGDDDDDDDDDDTGDDDDDSVSNPVASGTYWEEYDWGSELEADPNNWEDCTVNYVIAPTAAAPEPGCPGCFASFRVDFDWNLHTCGDIIPDDPADLTDINFGISGNTLWVYNYDLGDWQTWMTGTATSSSFVGQSSWTSDEIQAGFPFQYRTALDMSWF